MATPECKAFSVLQFAECESVISFQSTFGLKVNSDPNIWQKHTELKKLLLPLSIINLIHFEYYFVFYSMIELYTQICHCRA